MKGRRGLSRHSMLVGPGRCESRLLCRRRLRWRGGCGEGCCSGMLCLLARMRGRMSFLCLWGLKCFSAGYEMMSDAGNVSTVIIGYVVSVSSCLVGTKSQFTGVCQLFMAFVVADSKPPTLTDVRDVYTEKSKNTRYRDKRAARRIVSVYRFVCPTLRPYPSRTHRSGHVRKTQSSYLRHQSVSRKENNHSVR